jgi:hypothetical protein
VIALAYRASLGGHRSVFPTGWNSPARHARACCGHPRLFLGLALRSVGKIGCATSPRIARARFAHASMRNRRAANGAPDFELATGASSRRLPAPLPNDQKKRRPRVRRRQNLAALGYGRAHAHSILSMALREFSNEIRL